VGIVRPPNSLAAKLELLSDDEREIFEAWQRLSKKWQARHSATEPGGAYRTLINGTMPPLLPEPIRLKLFGPLPTLSADATVEQAARIYSEYKDRR
jgi:hypothetical protein